MFRRVSTLIGVSILMGVSSPNLPDVLLDRKLEIERRALQDIRHELARSNKELNRSIWELQKKKVRDPYEDLLLRELIASKKPQKF